MPVMEPGTQKGTECVLPWRFMIFYPNTCPFLYCVLQLFLVNFLSPSHFTDFILRTCVFLSLDPQQKLGQNVHCCLDCRKLSLTHMRGRAHTHAHDLHIYWHGNGASQLWVKVWRAGEGDVWWGSLGGDSGVSSQSKQERTTRTVIPLLDSRLGELEAGVQAKVPHVCSKSQNVQSVQTCITQWWQINDLSKGM